MLMVIARLKVAEGKEQEFETVAGELIAQVKDKEEGCLLYQLCKAQDGSYVFVERYKDQDAFGVHGQSEHFQAAMPKLGACLQGAPQIELLSEL